MAEYTRNTNDPYKDQDYPINLKTGAGTLEKARANARLEFLRSRGTGRLTGLKALF